MRSLHSNRTTRIISLEASLLAVFILTYKFLVYDISRLLMVGGYHHLDTPYEDFFPLLPGFVYIYFGCYFFWIVNYFLGLRLEKSDSRAFAAADILGETIAFFFFVFFPCTLIRPEIAGNTVSEKALLFLYRIDEPNNLFPSLHCFNSWLSWIAVRKNPRIPKGYRIFSLFLALLICFSTLVVKQHVIVDTFAGIFMAEFCHLLANRIFHRKNT